jgi:hypothetical protein
VEIIDCEDMEEAVDKIEQIMKGSDIIGNQRTEKSLANAKIVIAQAVKDWVKPYSNMSNIIPVVMFSTHPRFIAGTRLDFGFHSILYREGYTLIVMGKREDKK